MDSDYEDNVQNSEEIKQEGNKNLEDNTHVKTVDNSSDDSSKDNNNDSENSTFAIDNGNSESVDNSPKIPKVSVVREIVDWILHIAAAVIIALLIVKFVAQVTVVIGRSMMPTLQENNRLVMEKITNRFGTFKPGDVVVIEAKKELVAHGLPENHSPLIKRIIGVAGDRIQVKNGSVFVNGEQKFESYINGDYTDSGKYSDSVVPAGNVFVMGDNRLPNQSIDSRVLGPFETTRIVGRVLVRIFPINEFGSLPK